MVDIDEPREDHATQNRHSLHSKFGHALGAGLARQRGWGFPATSFGLYGMLVVVCAANAAASPAALQPQQSRLTRYGVYRAKRGGATGAADLLCSGAPAQSVAVCIAGAARTLTTPLLQVSIRDNLVRAIGGAVTVLAAVKLEDTRGNKDAGPMDAEKDPVTSALSFIAGGSQEHTSRLSEGAELSGDSDAPTCYGSPRWETNFLSLIGQLNGRKACGEMLEAEEARRGSRFDWVVLTRPDLAWWSSVRPVCLWNASVTTSARDWAYIGPRALAQRWLIDLPAKFFNCSDPDIQKTFSTKRNASTGDGFFDAMAEDVTMALGGPFEESTGLEFPVALTRGNDTGQPHDTCACGLASEPLVGTGGCNPFTDTCKRGCTPSRAEEERCLALTDYNPCGGAYDTDSACPWSLDT